MLYLIYFKLNLRYFKLNLYLGCDLFTFSGNKITATKSSITNNYINYQIKANYYANIMKMSKRLILPKNIYKDYIIDLLCRYTIRQLQLLS